MFGWASSNLIEAGAALAAVIYLWNKALKPTLLWGWDRLLRALGVDRLNHESLDHRDRLALVESSVEKILEQVVPPNGDKRTLVCRVDDLAGQLGDHTAQDATNFAAIEQRLDRIEQKGPDQ